MGPAAWPAMQARRVASNAAGLGLVAEYRLDQDVALDTMGFHNGRIVGGLWMPSGEGP